jgi:hypothetical protein
MLSDAPCGMLRDEMSPAPVRFAMSIEELVIEKLRSLSPHQKKEVFGSMGLKEESACNM